MSILKSKAHLAAIKQKVPFSIVFRNSKDSKLCTSQYFMKLNFFGKGITHIDKMISGKESISNIIQLDLSHNSISSLENVSQFKGLVFINLTHNFITDCQQILKLQTLPKIRTILVKGNPFCQKIISNEVCDFLLTQENDIDNMIVGEQTKKQFDYLLQESCKKYCLLNYLNKITLHTQLVNEYNMESYTPIIEFQKMKQLYEVFSQFTGNFDLIYQSGSKIVYLKKTNKLSTYECIRLTVIQQRQEIQTIESQIKERLAVLNRLKITAIQKAKIVQTKSRQGSPQKRYKQQQSSKNTTAKNTKLNQFQQAPREKAKDYFGRQIQSSFSKTERRINFDEQSHAKQTEGNSFSKTQIFNRSGVKESNANSKSIGKGSKVIDQNQQELQSQRQNPIYQLLYSPLNSLKPREKDLLIEALSKDLKQKNILHKKYQKLKSEFKIVKQQASKHKQILIQNVSQLKGKQQLARDYNQKLIKELKSLKGQNQFLQGQATQKQQQTVSKNKELDQINKKLQVYMKQTTQLRIKCQYYSRYLQDNEQIIQTARQKRIKQQYFVVLNQKAKRFSLLNKAKQINCKQTNKKMLAQCFSLWKTQVKQIKDLQKLQQKNQRRFVKQTLKTLSIFKQISLKTKQLKGMIKKSNGLCFFQRLSYSFKHTKIDRQKYFLFRTKRQNLIKRNIFESMLQSKQQKTSQQQMKTAINHHCFFLLKTSFKNILIFNKQVAYKQIQVAVCRNLKLKSQFIDLLVLKKSRNQIITNKYVQLRLFIETKRVRSAFYHVWLTTNKERQQNHVKTQYLRKIREKQAFQFINYFTQVKKQTRVLTQLKINQVRNLRKKNAVYRIFQRKAIKRNSINNFKSILTVLYKKKQIQQMKNQANQFLTQRVINRLRVKTFMQKLRQNKRMQIQLNYKKLQLNFRIYEIQTPGFLFSKQKFFKNLKYKATLQKKLRNHFTKRFYWRMFNYFNQWRMTAYKGKIMFLSEKLQELGPELCEISERQKQLNEQKIGLLRQLESKQQMIVSFTKKLEDRQFLIHTKDIKYQKLKALYTDVLQQKIFKEKQHEELLHRQVEESKDQESYHSKSMSNFKYSSIRNMYDRIQSMHSSHKKPEKDFDDSLQVFPTFRRF